MHIVLVHGYLLQGTGSNIYVANIAKAFKNNGHAVTLICQDRTADQLDFVDEFYTDLSKVPENKPDNGKLRVIVPPINNLLPVYVVDEYDGYEVKTVSNFTEEEIDEHIKLTGRAIKRIIPGGIDLLIANHAILSPVIAKRALEGTDIPYKVKIHGSAIEFQLVPYPFLMKYAVEGLSDAKEIIAGSAYIKKRLFNVFAEHKDDLKLTEKIKVVSPGTDPELFRLVSNWNKNNEDFIETIKRKILIDSSGRRAAEIDYPRNLKNGELHEWLVEKGNEYNQRAVDYDLPERFEPVSQEDFNIIYFGKFLETKGVGELLMLIPQMLEERKHMRFFFVGFGSYREHMEGIITAFKSGDKKLAKACAKAGNFITEVKIKTAFRKLKKKEMKKITVTGILDHEALSLLLPLMDLCVVPSKLAEAFGMVAVEAMSAGVLPIVNYHSGLTDIADNLIADFPKVEKLIHKERETFFEVLPDKIIDAYDFLYPHGIENREKRKNYGEKLREHAIKHYSWENIAEILLR